MTMLAMRAWTRGAALVCEARVFVLRATLHGRQLSGGGTLCRSAPVDLRSDTVTKPSAAMRAAMASAQVGDDVYGEDPTVQELEARAAELLGKEAAVLLPSGTMANLACILAHTRRGDQVLLSRHSHIYSWEQGNVSSLAGCITTPLDTRVDGTFALEELREVPHSLSVPYCDSIAHHDPTQPRLTSAPVLQAICYDDPHVPHARLVCLENSHAGHAGTAVPAAHSTEIGRLCAERELLLHIDGARLLNAGAARCRHFACHSAAHSHVSCRAGPSC